MVKIGVAEKDGITIRLLREFLSASGACVRCITHCRCDNRTMETVRADYLLVPIDMVCPDARLDLVISVNSELFTKKMSVKVMLENGDNNYPADDKISCERRIKFGMSRGCDITASSIGRTDNAMFVSCCVHRRFDGVLGNTADIGEYTFRIYGSNPPTACVLGASAAYIMCQNTKKGETLLLY